MTSKIFAVASRGGGGGGGPPRVTPSEGVTLSLQTNKLCGKSIIILYFWGGRNIAFFLKGSKILGE